MRSWVDLTFQRNEIADEISQFVGAQLVAIRRHRRAVDKGVLAQVRFLKRPQLFLGVEELDAEQIVIEQPSVDHHAIAGDDAERSLTRLNHGARIQDRLLQLDRASLSAHLAQIGPEPRADSSDAMTARTVALAFENRFAPSGIARRHCALPSR